MTAVCQRRSAVVVALLALCAVGLGCTPDDETAVPAPSEPAVEATARDGTLPAELPPADDDAAESPFYCGGLGEERPPTLLAVDLVSGANVWQACLEEAIPMFVIGRAPGATLLHAQDGRGGSSVVAVDDAGVERWSRPIRMDTSSPFVVAGSTVAVATDAVEFIDAATGDVVWTHPVSDGTPIGATDELVIEASGGPYSSSSEVAANGGSVEPMLRALDPASGEERWARPIELVDGLGFDQFRPMVGSAVVTVGAPDGTTAIIDAATGDDLRTEQGMIEPVGGLLIARSQNTYELIDVRDELTGEVLEDLPGEVVRNYQQIVRIPLDAGVLIESVPNTGPAARLTMVDVSSGAVRWEIPYQKVIGRSAEHVFVTDASALQVLDAEDGSVLLEYRAPSDLVRFESAVAGDGTVIVKPTFVGGAFPSGQPTQPPPAPDCSDGVTLLTTEIDSGPVVVRESADGRYACIEADGSEALVNTPSVPTAAPEFDAQGFFGAPGGAFPATRAWYSIALPPDFPMDVSVVDESGVPWLAARGVSGDYLLLLQPTIGVVGGQPAGAQRTAEVLGPDGEPLAIVSFSGFGATDGATFEEFFACAAEHGVEVGMGNGPTPAPATPEQLTAAWASCKELLASYMLGSQQGGREDIANFIAVQDCLAAKGTFPSLGHLVVEQGVFEVALSECQGK